MTKKDIKLNLNNKWLILCGLIGSVFFTFSWIIQEAFREGYNPMMNPISALAIGPLGWMQILTFFISGALIILFGYGLFNKRKNKEKLLSKWAPILIIICGIGLIGAGCFITDPINGYPQGTPVLSESPSLESSIHQIFSAFLFLGLPLACFVIGNYFAHKRDLKWLLYCFLTGMSFLVVFFLAMLGFEQIGGFQNYAGLLQRITITIGFLWMSLISVYFFKKQNR